MRSFFLIVLAGLVFLLANWVVPHFRDWLWRQSGISDGRLIKDDHVPVQIVGNFERLLAVILVAAHIPETYTVLALWLAAKLATSWQRLPIDSADEEANRQIRAGTLVALMAGIVSVGFGVVAGQLIRCVIAH